MKKSERILKAQSMLCRAAIAESRKRISDARRKAHPTQVRKGVIGYLYF